MYNRSPYCKVEVGRFVQLACPGSYSPTSAPRSLSVARGPAPEAGHHDEVVQKFEILHL